MKQLAEERGFRASIEETILGGAGEVDVSLVRGDLRIACEISVSSTRDQELGNVEKCLGAGYGSVILVGKSERHIQSLSKSISGNLEETERDKVRYATAETLVEFLDSLGLPASSEQTLRGYKLRTHQQALSPEESKARRRAIGSVVARSIKSSRKDQ